MNKTLQATGLYRMVQALTTEMDRDMPITIPMAFLRIAMAGEDGLDQETLQKDLAASSSGITRTTQTLSDRHYLKEREGLQLVQRVMHPQDLRRRILRLTPKGEKLLAKCAEAVYGRK